MVTKLSVQSPSTKLVANYKRNSTPHCVTTSISHHQFVKRKEGTENDSVFLTRR